MILYPKQKPPFNLLVKLNKTAICIYDFHINYVIISTFCKNKPCFCFSLIKISIRLKF